MKHLDGHCEFNQDIPWEGNKIERIFVSHKILPNSHVYQRILPQPYVINHLDLKTAEKKFLQLQDAPTFEETGKFSDICKDSLPTNIDEFNKNFNNPKILHPIKEYSNRPVREMVLNSLSVSTFESGKKEDFKTPLAFKNLLAKNHEILKKQTESLQTRSEKLDQEKFYFKSFLGLSAIAGFFTGGATVLVNNFFGTSINPVKTGSMGAAITAASLAGHNLTKENEKRQLQKHIILNNATLLKISTLVECLRRFDRRITPVGSYNALSQMTPIDQYNAQPILSISKTGTEK